MKLFNDLSLQFNLRKEQKASYKLQVIYCRISCSNKRKNLSTGLYVSQSAWCSQTEKVKSKEQNSVEINNQLALIKQQIINCYFESKTQKQTLTIDEIQQNYNATRNRFTGVVNENVVAKKYASRFVDTYTVTAGSESITATFTNNALAGVRWDTSTARSIVLTLQDTLTPGIYYDTITATDIYGSSSRLPRRQFRYDDEGHQNPGHALKE